jgi:hypothetical protein
LTNETNAQSKKAYASQNETADRRQSTGIARPFGEPEGHSSILRQWHLEGGSQSHSEKPGLILVDRSVWIDFLSSSPSSAGAELRRMIAKAEPFALAGVIVTEILQGLKRNVSRQEHYLSQREMLEPKGFSTCREAVRAFSGRTFERCRRYDQRRFDRSDCSRARRSLFTLDKDFTRIAGMSVSPLCVLTVCTCQAAHALAQQPTMRQFAKRRNGALRKGSMFDFLAGSGCNKLGIIPAGQKHHGEKSRLISDHTKLTASPRAKSPDKD